MNKCFVCDENILYIGFINGKEQPFCSEECLEASNCGMFMEFRICSACNSTMFSGYVIEDGQYYCCEDKCLEQIMSKEEYIELYDNGEGNSYWTNFN